MDVRDYLLKLEDNLMVGGGRWVADFNESFWDYPMGDLVFDMFITATVRPKGVFLSRVAAWLTTPNYYVACFAYSKDPGLKRLHEVLTTISKFLKDEEFAWAWLVIPHEGTFSTKARAIAESHDSREIGLALVDLDSQEIISGPSYWARKMTRFIKCFK
ncbi:MAG: hypothetical protein GTO63_09555 [Anaerolineae bacterium]|nr:hypothetical protein [Anaerolineae bacterium]NIN95130.1 hypothetical protein [Anaerolineae bacterium]NIQ78982.1 hypothetical protein [Anaerolineae bacterium]